MTNKIFLLIFLALHANAAQLLCPLPECSALINDFGTKKLKNGFYSVHTGVDFEVKEGTPVKAAVNGKVLKSGKVNGYGIRVMLEHEDGLKTLYAHLSRVSVKQGSLVNAGDVIGYTGNSGASTTPHLHFGVYQDGKMVDPQQYLK